MIKVKTIGMIEKNAKNNPVVKAHQDLKNGALHIVTNGITEFPTLGTSETKQTKNICIALNTGSGDEKYTDLTIKKGDFVNSYLLDAWENQEIILDESHITYEQSQDYSKINFHTNIKNALDSGIHCSVYHYSYAVDVQDVINEANFCLENIKGYNLEYPVAFDIEDKSMEKLSKRMLTDICKAFCDTIEHHGYYVSIYTNINWLENYLYKDELLPKYDLWLADWGKDKPSYLCGLWQFSNKGCVYGINGDVDMNLSYKNYPKIIKNKGLNGFTNDTNYFTYTVKRGDTLWNLSKIFLGSGTKYKETKNLNNLTQDTIYVGQILKIPK